MTTKRFIAKNGIDNNSQTLTNIADPVNAQDAATRAFVLASTPSSFVAGTRLAFSQAAAPTGWTQDTSDAANNRMLRVVNTTGGGTGGSHSPILNNVVPAHTHGFSTGTESADHGHSGNTGYVSSDHAHGIEAHYGQTGAGGNSNAGFTGGYNAVLINGTGGINANHYHGFNTGGRSAAHTHSGSTDNGSSQTNWTPRYIDMIVCVKN